MARASDFPSLRDWNSVNYLLLAVASVTGDAANESCAIKTANMLCSSRVFGGEAIDLSKAIRLANRAGFLLVHEGNLWLTDQGREFIRLNIDSTYEISLGQKEYLLGNMLLDGPWQSSCRALFSQFEPNYNLLTFEMQVSENPFFVKWAAAMHALKGFGVIEERAGIAYIMQPFVIKIRDLMRDTLLSQEELESLLEADRELASQAEEAVVKYEQQRLRAMGRLAEFELVKRISQLDATAGYDIASFDGISPGLLYDRFIEVKCSRQPNFRFYWSDPEYRAAKKLGEKYWIYFLAGFQGKSTAAIVPITIQNPVRRILETNEYSLTPVKYRVEKVP